MTNSTELPDQEPINAPTGAEPPKPKSKLSRKSTASVRRELTDRDLANPAVARLFMDDVERLEQEVAELPLLRVSFHNADKRAAVLDQRLNQNTSQEIVFGVCTMLAGVAFGYAPSVWKDPSAFGPMALAVGIILLVCAFVAKAVRA